MFPNEFPLHLNGWSGTSLPEAQSQKTKKEVREIDEQISKCFPSNIATQNESNPKGKLLSKRPSRFPLERKNAVIINPSDLPHSRDDVFKSPLPKRIKKDEVPEIIEIDGTSTPPLTPAREFKFESSFYPQIPITIHSDSEESEVSSSHEESESDSEVHIENGGSSLVELDHSKYTYKYTRKCLMSCEETDETGRILYTVSVKEKLTVTRIPLSYIPETPLSKDDETEPT